MNLQLLSFLLGALLLLVAILGGGFEIKEVKVPKVGSLARVGAFIVGAFFLYVGLVGHEALLGKRGGGSDPGQKEHTASETTQAPAKAEADREVERQKVEAGSGAQRPPAPGDTARPPAGEAPRRPDKLLAMRFSTVPSGPTDPLDDPRVQSAMEMALQRNELKRARQLMAEAGHPDGLALTISMSRFVEAGGREADVDTLIRDLDAIGIRLQVTR